MRTSLNSFVVIAFVLCVNRAAGQGGGNVGARPADISSAPIPMQAGSEPRYRIGPGDVLDVRVFGRPQLTGEAVRVDEDGMIRLPMIPDALQAGCSTEVELSKQIVKAYSEYLVDPQVSVTIKQYSSQIVDLVGAVQRPGTFQLQRRVRLRELITIAGGLSQAAGGTVLISHSERRANCEAAPGTLSDLTAINTPLMLAGDPASNPYVAPGDFINAVEADRAFVVGNVYKPSPIPLQPSVTLTRALAMTGGELPGSKDNIRIIRRPEGQSRLQVLPFSMKAILSNKEEDPAIRPGDIVEVGVSFTKALAKSMAAALATTGVVYFPLTYIH